MVEEEKVKRRLVVAPSRIRQASIERIEEFKTKRKAQRAAAKTRKELNQELLDFFTAGFKPGLIGLVGATDPVSRAIREAQKPLTTDGKPSFWSHCFVLGELRPDLHGPGRTLHKSPYIFESDISGDAAHLRLHDGAQENWVGKWCRNLVDRAAIIDFRPSRKQRELIFATALQLVNEQLLYPVGGLVGTWLAIATRKQWLPNPYRDQHAMFCSTFVRHCYKEAGCDFIKTRVSMYNTTPEDIARAGIAAGSLKLLR